MSANPSPGELPVTNPNLAVFNISNNSSLGSLLWGRSEQGGRAWKRPDCSLKPRDPLFERWKQKWEGSVVSGAFSQQRQRGQGGVTVSGVLPFGQHVPPEWWDTRCQFYIKTCTHACKSTDAHICILNMTCTCLHAHGQSCLVAQKCMWTIMLNIMPMHSSSLLMCVSLSLITYVQLCVCLVIPETAATTPLGEC